MRKPKVPREYWPSVRYGPDDQWIVCYGQEDVPEGWGRRPGEFAKLVHASPPALNRDHLIEQLQALGVLHSAKWSTAYMKELVDEKGVPSE